MASLKSVGKNVDEKRLLVSGSVSLVSTSFLDNSMQTGSFNHPAVVKKVENLAIVDQIFMLER